MECDALTPGLARPQGDLPRDDTSVLEALRAGARSYLTKDADRTDIAQALRAAAGGLTVFDPRVHATLLAATSRPLLHPARQPLPDRPRPRGRPARRTA